jgi:uncharacterized protein YjiS (DUF1127 family)
MSAYNVKAHSAFAGYDFADSNGSANGMRGLFARVAKWREQRRNYHQVLFELEQLTDRDLADIGINRSDIAAVARGEKVAR